MKDSFAFLETFKVKKIKKWETSKISEADGHNKQNTLDEKKRKKII